MRHLPILFLTLLLTACQQHRPTISSDPLLGHAKKILSTVPIVDTHIDFPWHLVEHKKWYLPGYERWALQNPEGDFDFERARKGGLSGPFMSIYIPSQYQAQKGRSKEIADSLINMVYAIVQKYPEQFALAPNADDIERNFNRGIISLPMGMENGSPISTIADVAYFHNRGIRYITLTHGKDNQICDSSYDTLHTNNGLSPFGKKVVEEMNRLGIMVDVSHLSDKSIVDVLKIAQKPLIATHSGCRKFTPGFERNLPDSLIIAIARTGGVIQIPFSQYFLDGQSRYLWKRADEIRDSLKIPEYGPETLKFIEEYSKKQNRALFWLSEKAVADHIDYVKKLVGIDHVGLGSDFDGVGYALPLTLKDVSRYPYLLAELLRRGYTDDEIRKICSGNVLRVWKANETERKSH